MRIDPSISTQRAQEPDTATASNARPGAAQSGEAAAQDTAQLSPDQVRLQTLAAQVNALPEIRQERVDSLSRAVREGTYQVSAEQTAEAMLSEFAAPAAA